MVKFRDPATCLADLLGKGYVQHSNQGIYRGKIISLTDNASVGEAVADEAEKDLFEQMEEKDNGNMERSYIGIFHFLTRILRRVKRHI